MTTQNYKQQELHISHLRDDVRDDLQQIIQWFEYQDINLSMMKTISRDVGADYNLQHSGSQLVNETLAQLNYDYSVYTLQHYIQYVGQFLHRELQIVAMKLSRSTTGACIRLANHDIIFFNDTRHPLLQEHVIVHETAHLLLDHQMINIRLDDKTSMSNSDYRSLLSHLRSNEPIMTVRDAILNDIDLTQEAEAEAFAKRFLTQAKAYKNYQTLRERRDSRLFPPFSELS
ncbi:MAG: hypothetical protein AAFV93_11085 [Chloroflexota bacterium]